MNQSLNLLKKLNIEKNSPLILGCSGGPDSMCLLHLLKSNNYRVICAHVNHNIRLESTKEYSFVKDYCERNNISFEGLELEKTPDKNESYYRQKRHEFYKQLAMEYNTSYILTAHHGDDLIETILMRLTRGSYLRGYGGFEAFYKENDFSYIKPLIYYTKKDIINYNTENKIPYVTDPSNNDETYTRNKYRHQMLPFLKSLSPEIHQKYLQFSESIIETENFIDSLLEKQIEDNFKENYILLDRFLTLDKYLQKREIEKILKKLYKNDVDKLQVFHIDSILYLLETEKNKSIDLPLGLKAIREYDKLIFVRETENKDYYLELQKEVLLPNGDKILKVDSSDDTSNNTIFLNSHDLHLPLYIRNRKEKDKINIKNSQGHKSIKSLFIDEKIPKSERATYPLLVDNENTILWVPGLRKSKFDNENKEKCDIILKYIKKGDKTNEN